MRRMSVDLPAPLGPTMNKNSPCWMCSVTSCSAGRFPYRLVTWYRLTMGCRSAATACWYDSVMTYRPATTHPHNRRGEASLRPEHTVDHRPGRVSRKTPAATVRKSSKAVRRGIVAHVAHDGH